MKNYQELLKNVLINGEIESQRALVNNQQVNTKVLYNQRLDYDLGKNGLFPLVTCKKTSFRIVVEELKWFLRGIDNVQSLKEQKVNIWNEWASETGHLGTSYPSTWRDFDGTWHEKGCDQIRQLEKIMILVRKNGLDDPVVRQWKRRLLLSSWNPNITDNRGPVGCHTFAQWHLSSGVRPEGLADPRLHCTMYMRSVDLFLGLPYNIGVYALLTNIFARIAGLKPGLLTIIMGNAHLYSNSWVETGEIVRCPTFPPPILDLKVGSVDDWEAELLGYQSGPACRVEIAV